MTHEQIEAIRKRAENATEGPWKFGVKGSLHSRATHEQVIYPTKAGIVIPRYVDSRFITHAREDIPALLAEVERLREALEFYGNHGWADGVVDTAEGDRFEDAPPIFYDCGKIARDVLGGDA